MSPPSPVLSEINLTKIIRANDDHSSVSSSTESSRSGDEFVNLSLTDTNPVRTYYNVVFDHKHNAESLVENYANPDRTCINGLLDGWVYKRAKKRYFAASAKVRRFWRKVMAVYESIYEELRFPIMPDHVDPESKCNHLSAGIWICTFGMVELWKGLDASEMNKITELFAELIYEAMDTEESIRGFKKPVSTITEIGLDLCNKMRYTMLLRDTCKYPSLPKWAPYVGDYMQTLEAEKEDYPKDLRYYKYSKGPRAGKIGLPAIKINMARQMVFDLLEESESPVDEAKLFERLKIYAKTKNSKWHLWAAIPKEQKVQMVTDIMRGVIGSLVRLRELLPSMLAILVQGIGKQAVAGRRKRKPTLLKHLNSMASALLSAAVQYADFLINDEMKINIMIGRVESNVQDIIKRAQEIISHILQVLAMSQLCFLHLQKSASIPLQPYGQIVKTYFDSTALFSYKDFNSEDFFKTQYPDILRTVPVVINCTELSLHLRRNSDESSSTAPGPSDSKIELVRKKTT